jgi:hypothetical protein
MELYQQGEEIPTVESLMNYRSQGEDELFELWCNTLVGMRIQPGDQALIPGKPNDNAFP